jgi:hypothetical protein
MFKSKVLTDSAWKDALAKNRGVKDNGLLKALAEIRKLDDTDHDGAQELLDQIQKLVAQLRKSKEAAAVPAVGKFLVELTAAADAAVGAVPQPRLKRVQRWTVLRAVIAELKPIGASGQIRESQHG